MNPDLPPRSFWQRRVRDPLIVLLTHGLTADKLALTFAVGTTCSFFPFLGFTSLLNLGVGLWLRLNQPLLQTLNQVLTAPHLVMIVVYVRLGEWLWRAQDDHFSISEMLRVFREANLGEFFHQFGWAGIHALTAWAVTSPLLIALVYYILRPVLRRLASKAAAQP